MVVQKFIMSIVSICMMHAMDREDVGTQTAGSATPPQSMIDHDTQTAHSSDGETHSIRSGTPSPTQVEGLHITDPNLQKLFSVLNRIEMKLKSTFPEFANPPYPQEVDWNSPQWQVLLEKKRKEELINNFLEHFKQARQEVANEPFAYIEHISDIYRSLRENGPIQEYLPNFTSKYPTYRNDLSNLLEALAEINIPDDILTHYDAIHPKDRKKWDFNHD